MPGRQQDQRSGVLKSIEEQGFAEISRLIEVARGNTLRTVDTASVDLFGRSPRPQPESTDGGVGRGRNGPAGGVCGSDATRLTSVYACQSVPHASVLRDLARGRESRTTGATTYSSKESTCEDLLSADLLL